MLMSVAVVAAIAMPLTANAATGFGGYGLVNQSVGVCLWARAHYRVPSNNPTATLDFNVYGYKESAFSCNHASPWLSVTTVELGIQARLWKSDGSFCAETTARIVPNGTATPTSWGRAYTRSGNCATGTLTVYAHATSFVLDWTTIRSQVQVP